MRCLWKRAGRDRSLFWNGKEKALRMSTARKPRLLAHTRASATCFSRNARILPVSLLKPMASSLSPLAFPVLSVQFRNTLRVCRDISLPVPDDQRELRECVLFPTQPVGWTCPTFQCLAQPLVRCTSATLQPFLKRPLSQTPHTFRQHLARSTDTFTSQRREDDRRALVDNRLKLLWVKSSITFLLESVATLN